MDSLKAFLRANVWLILAALLVAGALYQFVDPAPPREITIAAGSEGGRYHALAEILASELEKQRVAVHVISTAGSAENINLLMDPEGAVSIAFTQSGMEEIVDTGEVSLSSLGGLYYEPVWLFYRKEIGLESVTDLAGRRIALGERGSGTQAVGRYLLEENGLAPDAGALFVEAGGQDAVELLRNGEVDAAFFTLSPESETIRELIALPDVDFADIDRSEAYTARFPFLSSVQIFEGLLDLAHNIPGSDRTTLASTATLVVNERFHPALTPMVLEALSPAIESGGFLEEPGEFPSPHHVGYPLTKEADHYYEYGPPLLLRYLPFWAASLVDRLIIFVIPLLVILIPLSKVAGPLYRWRIRSRIYRWYRFLLEIDRGIVEGRLGGDVAEERRKLADMESELAAIDVPLSYADDLYQLKQHLEYVSRRLAALTTDREPGADA